MRFQWQRAFLFLTIKISFLNFFCLVSIFSLKKMFETFLAQAMVQEVDRLTAALANKDALVHHWKQEAELAEQLAQVGATSALLRLRLRYRAASACRPAPLRGGFCRRAAGRAGGC